MSNKVDRGATCKSCLHFDVCCAHWAFSSDGTRTANDYKMLMAGKTPCTTFFKQGSDVVDARRGKWVNKDRKGVSADGYMFCSECDVMIPNCDDLTRYCLSTLYFCPNCGADMRGNGE